MGSVLSLFLSERQVWRSVGVHRLHVPQNQYIASSIEKRRPDPNPNASLVVTKGGPSFTTLVLPLYIYQNGFEYLRFGDAAAMTVVMFGANMLMIGASTVSLRFLTGNPVRH
jgi:hypothetical protein